jgi:hypothetical protein
MTYLSIFHGSGDHSMHELIDGIMTKSKILAFQLKFLPSYSFKKKEKHSFYPLSLFFSKVEEVGMMRICCFIDFTRSKARLKNPDFVQPNSLQ